MQNGRFITLGIETSCDETSVAVLEERGHLLANLVASQVKFHERFGGVVPELAARQHEVKINPLVEAALETAGIRLSEIDLIGVTVGPGLAVSLGIGISCARMLALLLGTQCVGVNHLIGHLAAAFLTDGAPRLPAVCLLVSGGHTELYRLKTLLDVERLGGTIDDAAGESFDKVARMLGLGYPGGPAIETAAKDAKNVKIRFPRPMIDRKNHDFSFSGLKTAVLNYLKSHPDAYVPEVAAAFQDAAVDVLVEKTIRATTECDVEQIVVCGGVAANGLLRTTISRRCVEEGFLCSIPPLELCTDNAAMIAKAAYEITVAGRKSYPLTPMPNLQM